MEKEDFYKKLSNYPVGSLLNLQWDRGNGTLERLVRFIGFKDDSPLLYFDGGSLLDIDKIGGYSSIISIQKECPHKACVYS
ncbi:MAG: hypothetical protein NTU63_02035 [Candidatus Pacearchaeota archaeon]|nr:hypothetical protein [Candidatus Pacearchaeota archaeon]